jgi:hypothetical protein
MVSCYIICYVLTDCSRSCIRGWQCRDIRWQCKSLYYMLCSDRLVEAVSEADNIETSDDNVTR